MKTVLGALLSVIGFYAGADSGILSCEQSNPFTFGWPVKVFVSSTDEGLISISVRNDSGVTTIYDGYVRRPISINGITLTVYEAYKNKVKKVELHVFSTGEGRWIKNNTDISLKCN